MNKWYDKLNKEKNTSVRCFVSLSNKNPLDNKKLIVANIWGRIVAENGETVFTEIHSGNHYQYAIPCEDAVATFLNEYVASIKDTSSCSYDDFLDSILCKHIDGVFHVQNMEDKYNKLIKEISSAENQNNNNNSCHK